MSYLSADLIDLDLTPPSDGPTSSQQPTRPTPSYSPCRPTYGLKLRIGKTNFSRTRPRASRPSRFRKSV